MSPYCNLVRRAGSAQTLHLHTATTFFQRTAGLFLYGPLSCNEGLWLAPCNAVHTFGLHYAIDVIFLDVDGRVLKIRHALQPNRTAWCLKARSVIELPAYYCRRNKYFRHAITRAQRHMTSKRQSLLE